MCGILGFATSSSHDYSADFSDALNLLFHRGPDCQNQVNFRSANYTLSLGHTRLAIVDLTKVADQPMTLTANNLSIIFNGEIYNYREIKKYLISQGYQFKSQSDTEVLLSAWDFWHEDCLSKVVGMFSFCIYDKDKHRLTCVRDQYGIKPCYYASTPTSFGFSSEIKSLLQFNKFDTVCDYSSAASYLLFSETDLGANTFYQNINALIPGHMIHFDLNKSLLSNQIKWSSVPNCSVMDISLNESADMLRTQFLKSVDLHSRADVPLCLTLSGGIDSSAIAAGLRHNYPTRDIHVFSFLPAQKNINEGYWIKLLSSSLKLVNHFLEIEKSELAHTFDELILTQGEPFVSSSVFAQLQLYRLIAKSGFKVTLDGQGADEMLGGYHGFLEHRINTLIASGCFMQAINLLRNASSLPGRSPKYVLSQSILNLLPAKVSSLLTASKDFFLKPSWITTNSITWPYRRNMAPKYLLYSETGLSFLKTELNHRLSRYNLPQLLRFADRNSMHSSVESRFPFLTKELQNLMFSFPESSFVSDIGVSKYLFRLAMTGLVPPQILSRTDKIGFQTSEPDWMINLLPFVDSLPDTEDIPLVDIKTFKRYFIGFTQGVYPYTSSLWRTLNYIRWHQLNFNL